MPPKPLSVLIVEDSEDDALLLVRALHRGGYTVRFEQSDSAETMREALDKDEWDVVLADYSLPDFSGMTALEILQRSGRDIPFIIVSGAIGEDAAVAAMKAGAHDYISKGSLARLIPAVERELAEAAERRERRRAEEALYESQRTISSTLDSLHTQIAILDEEGVILYVNRAWREFAGEHFPTLMPGMSGINFLNFLYSNDRSHGKKTSKRIIQGIRDVIFEKCPEFRLESPYTTPIGRCWISLRVTQFVGEGPVQVVLAIEEITARKQMEARLEYLSLHDSLTGLYNRACFETAFQRFAKQQYQPVGIIVCDINGLKLVNNTLGDEVGDQLLLAAAGILKKAAPDEAVVMRIGGDEFAVLLPRTSSLLMEKVLHNIRQGISDYNGRNRAVETGQTLSMSMGCAIAKGFCETSLAACFKEADNNMYREKLHDGQSARSAIVQTVMKLLEARDFLTEGHAERLQDIVACLGRELELPESKIADLRLLAQFHDIGKVGIPDSILFKPGPLTQEEYTIMKRHCDIGYRIAQVAPDLNPIAEQILKHHEWWNGQGYPLGLEGENIPLECRILTIADAYDAMTSDRPYRKAMGHDEAVLEIKRCAGVQFDAELVEKFVAVVGKKDQAELASEQG